MAQDGNSVLSLDDLISDPGSVPVEEVVDLSDWNLSYVYEYKNGSTGNALINREDKTIEFYVPQGMELFEENNNVLIPKKFLEVLEMYSNVSIFLISIRKIANTRLILNLQATCEKLVPSMHLEAKNVDFYEEPLDNKFEWPNKIRMNLCTALSTGQAVGCKFVSNQYACDVAYKPDSYLTKTYINKNKSITIKITESRYGIGNKLYTFSYFKDNEKIFDSLFGPQALTEIPTDKDLHTDDDINQINYFGPDFQLTFEKYLLTTLDTLSDAENDFEETIHVNPSVTTEYLEYVKQS